MKYSVIDCETNGINIRKDQLIEVAMYTVDNSNIINGKNFFVKLEPGKILPSKVIEDTGITKRDLDKGLGLKESLDLIKNYIGSDPIIVQNSIMTLGFLKDISPAFYDMKTINSILIPDIKPTILNVSHYIGFDKYIPCNSLGDAFALAVIFNSYYTSLGLSMEDFKNKILEGKYVFTPKNAELINLKEWRIKYEN